VLLPRAPLPSSPTRRSSDLHPVTVAVVGSAAVHVFAVGAGVSHVWSAADEAGVFDRIEQVTGIDVEEIAEHGAEAVLDGLADGRSEEHTSELQSRFDLVCRL